MNREQRDMEHKIKTIEQIKNEICKENKNHTGIKNIPELINFTFDELYKEIVLKINMGLGISSRCSLDGFSRAAGITKKFHNDDWSKNEYKDKIKNYWFIGNYINDYFIMDKNGKIYYCEICLDKNREKYILETFIDLNINFEQWLQFAYMDKDNDEIIDDIYYGSSMGMDSVYYEDDDKENLEKYKNKLLEISKELSDFIWNINN
jgi:hypothetical protein